MIKKFSTYVALIMVILSFSLNLVGCGNSKETGSTIDRIQNSNKIVLGTCADYPPYEFHRQVDGKDEIVGFDINIAKEVAKDLGVELEIKDMDFSGLLSALNTGNVDFVVAGMTPDEERKKNVDFSKIYYDPEQGLLIRSEDVEKYKSIEDLKGMKVGAQKGTVQEEVAEDVVEGSEVKALGKITNLVLELKNNKIDGIVLATPVAEAYEKANSDLVLSPYIDFGKEGGVAIAVKKGNKELVDSINNTIDRLMKDDSLEKFIQEATILSEEE
jgi:ABC-type amino acid transport substrate-binding protein